MFEFKHVYFYFWFDSNFFMYKITAREKNDIFTSEYQKTTEALIIIANK